MDLNKEFERRAAKIDELKDFIVLYANKEESIAELGQLQNDTHEATDLVQKCVEKVDRFKESNLKRFKELQENAQYLQRVMLNVMEELEKKNEISKENKPESPMVKVFSEQKSNIQREPNTPLRSVNRNLETPCSLADYMKSPYTARRMKPISLQFTDFVYNIPVEEFNKVPSYMKGRESVYDIQAFLDTIVIPCFTAKYTLLPKRREAVRPIEVELWNLYKAQEVYFRGRFITQGDICRLINKQIDRKLNNRLTILRHLNILTEERKNAAICYIWNSK